MFSQSDTSLEPEVWEETEGHIRNILTELEIPFTEDVGEAAFYGPKVDINAKNEDNV